MLRMSKYLALLFISALLCLSAHEADGEYHQCNHAQENITPQFIDVDEDLDEVEGRGLAGAPNFKIYPHYDTLAGGSSEFRSYIRYDLVPPVLSYFQSALRSRYPLTSALKVPTNVPMMCEYRTPRILQTTGVSADHFMFFVIGSSGSNFVATSMYCYLASGTNRPVVSRVKFNTNGLKIPRGDVLLHETNTYVVLHEIIHSLGFSESLYPFFLDEQGLKRKNHVKKVQLHGSVRTVLDLPSLTSRVRRHFGCSSLPGAYLENNGDAELTAGSHFERKHFLMDLMTSGVLPGRRVSEFSLAVLEGSGWYYPDYNYAEPYSFGAGQGCGFVNNKCGAQAQFEEFCSKPSEKGCAPSGRGGGYCKSDPNSDGCKYYAAASFLDCENPNARSQTRLPELQVFGREVGSKCFEGTLSSRTNDKQNTFCFRYSCSGSGAGSRVTVQIGNRNILCERAGNIQVAGYQGFIKCPDPLSFCQTAGKKYCPRNCMGRGTCSGGKCKCYKGFTGVDCSLRI